MTNTSLKVFLSTLFLAFSFGIESHANADLVAGSLSADARADQQVRIPAGSPLTGAPFNIPENAVFDFSSIGSFVVDWEAEAGGIATISDFSAVFDEVHPDLGPYTLLAVGDGPGASFSGELSNIVDDNGSLISADMTIRTTFSLTFTGPGLGNPMLYTQDEAVFVGRIATDGSGIDFASPDPMNDDLDIFFSNPLGPDPLAAISFNRTVTGITAVPEPASCVFGGVLGLMVALRRRKGRVVNGQ